MNKFTAITVSTAFLFSAVPCWAQKDSRENPVPFHKVQQVENCGEKTLSGRHVKTKRILVSESKRGQKEVLPNPMPKPTKGKKGVLPDPMPKPIKDKKAVLPDPMPKPIKDKKAVLPNPMPRPADSKSLPGDPKP
jgi:hypothetical protein